MQHRAEEFAKGIDLAKIKSDHYAREHHQDSKSECP